MQIYILLGAPGVGKGTVAEVLCEGDDYYQLSTGQLFRDEIAAESELGLEVKGYIDKGELVPDATVVNVAAKAISEKIGKVKGVFLDGFPRTVPQAEALDATLDGLDEKLTGTIVLSADEDLLITRLVERRMCRGCGALFNLRYAPPKKEGVCDQCGGELYQRSDDSEKTVRNRLEVYEEQTQPLVDFYAETGRVKKIHLDNDLKRTLDAVYSFMAECS